MSSENSRPRVGRYVEIEGEAYERYLMELIRNWAAEELRLGSVGRLVIKDVRLVGDSYPHWGIEMDAVNPRTGREDVIRFPFRGDPSLFDAERPRENTEGSEVISDFLLQIFEGG